MRLNSNLILRQVGGEYMIVNPFSETMDMAQVYSLNETAAWLWKQLENKEFTVDEAGALLCNEYEVNKRYSPKRCQRAVPTMVRNWVSHRIRQKDDLSPITKGFHAFAKARTVGPAGRLFRPFSSR